MPNLDSVRYLIKEKNNPLNIIVMGATHERYETAVCNTENKFYSLYMGKEWNVQYGRIPNNYYTIKELPQHINYDLILCHTSCDRLDSAVEFKNYFGIPLVRITHVLPDIRYNIRDQINHFHRHDDEIDADLFISKFNANEWKSQGQSINHGIETIWQQHVPILNRKNICISAVNFWADRDWACGWNLWNETIKLGLEYEVCGNNLGLSKPFSGQGLVNKYNEHKIYLNTSLHSPVPMALLEAMSCGCVPVTTNTCMIPEIIKHGVNGFMADNAQDLYKYCKMVLEDDGLAESLSAAAVETIKEKFNINNFTHNWNQCFENLFI